MMQFRQKRIMEGSLFDVHRAEPSQQPIAVPPSLDMKRAESSQQHVRALNTQFARSIFLFYVNKFAFTYFHISIFLFSLYMFFVNEKKSRLMDFAYFVYA